jgi:hypothetical protein
LPALSVPPAFGYAAAYQLPADCLFVREVGEGDDCPWEVEGGTLFTDMAAPLRVKYTRAVVNPAAFDALFAEALAVRLASEIAVSLTESVGKAQALWQVYQSKLTEARRRDAQERGREDFVEGYWLQSR